MAVVKDSDLEVVLSLLKAALGGAFRPGGVLDQWEEETGNDLVEAGEVVARVSKVAGLSGGGYIARELYESRIVRDDPPDKALEALWAFGDRLARTHERLSGAGLCRCDRAIDDDETLDLDRRLRGTVLKDGGT